MHMYSVNNSTVTPVDSTSINNLKDTIPVGTYIICKGLAGFYFERIEDVHLPEKIYGRANAITKRIIHTFGDRKNSTGVLLCGDKGSGKTLQSKMLSAEMAKLGVPTIIITEPLHDEAFKSLINGISCPVVILFDEFEKVYHESEHQQALLTLFDGTFDNGKKLYVFTANNKRAIGEYMISRPGRIYYSIEYSYLTDEEIIEFCQDNLNNKDHIDMMIEVASNAGGINFDVMGAICQECNRYNETPVEAIQYLNISENNDVTHIDMAITKDGVKMFTDDETVGFHTHIKFSHEFTIYANEKDFNSRGRRDNVKSAEVRINSSNIVVNRCIPGKEYVWEKDGYTFIGRVSKPVSYDFKSIAYRTQQTLEM